MNNDTQNEIPELRVLEDNNNIFNTDIEYIIPLYQRAYAWEDRQITQLIDDILDISKANENKKYYIGSLTVSKQGNKYEVVDGQQRLTTLYLLLNYLGLDVKPTLTFACREKSNYTLENIKAVIKNSQTLDPNRIEPTIQRGIQIINQELADKPKQSKFRNGLKKVVLFQIEVPKHTDLNRYFETMNTRGEQLEQHDILKATLMGDLEPEEQSIFANIWDACSDMTGYVQMHFIPETRQKIFGSGWDAMPFDDWMSYAAAFKTTEEEPSITNTLESEAFTLEDIIKPTFKEETNDGVLEDDTRVRFESIIDFPYFLLHTLRVMIDTEEIKHVDGKTNLYDALLDDKKLIDSFNRVIDNGSSSGKEIKENRAKFSKEFVIYLLKTRFLFDKYILKREFANDNSEGEWSLKSLKVSDKKPYYVNTDFLNGANPNQNTTPQVSFKENLMIQAALRVSYTSPKVMHWVTELLTWLSKGTPANHMDEYASIAEKIAKSAVQKNFITPCTANKRVFAMGVDTPHIVFN